VTVARFVFDAAAAVAVLFGGLMVVTRNSVRSVLTLVVAFFALAVTYVMLLSPFIAAIQVIVYAGAILVLFLFVLMLLNIGHIPAERSGSRDPLSSTDKSSFAEKWVPGLVRFANVARDDSRVYAARSSCEATVESALSR